MKTLVALISIMFFVACGGTGPVVCKTNQDCHTGEKCVQGMCEETTCFSSADCISLHSVGWVCDMSTGQCVEKPECMIDSDCQDNSKVCSNYKCVPYLSLDSCANQACTGNCANCGKLTYCYEGTCIEACLAKDKFYDEAETVACTGEPSNCLYCECWNKIPHEDEDFSVYPPVGCKLHTYAPCTYSSDLDANSPTGISSKDWDKIAQDMKKEICI